MNGTNFVSIRYQASRIVEAASAAYWLDAHGANGSAVDHQRGEIRRALAELKALIELEDAVMTPRHPLDGNARAADAHYGQDRPEDYTECAVCGDCFDEVEQHPVMFNLCQDCAPDDDIGWIE